MTVFRSRTPRKTTVIISSFERRDVLEMIKSLLRNAKRSSSPHAMMIGSEGKCNECGQYGFLRGGWCPGCCKKVGVPFAGRNFSKSKVESGVNISWQCEYCGKPNADVDRCTECGASRCDRLRGRNAFVAYYDDAWDGEV